jgi:hypothetical protein
MEPCEHKKRSGKEHCMSEDNIIKFQGYTFDTFKEVTNRDRADIGEVALKAFIAAAGSSGEMDADIRDLICDLLHLARWARLLDGRAQPDPPLPIDDMVARLIGRNAGVGTLQQGQSAAIASARRYGLQRTIQKGTNMIDKIKTETQTFTMLPAAPGWYLSFVVVGPPDHLSDSPIIAWEIEHTHTRFSSGDEHTFRYAQPICADNHHDAANDSVLHAPDGKYYDYDGPAFDSAEKVLEHYVERRANVAKIKTRRELKAIEGGNKK